MPRKNARPSPAKLKTDTMVSELKKADVATGNDRFLVLDFERHYTEHDNTSKYRFKVYLLPPGARFEGFGGSSSGLVTGKTPSMIVRSISLFDMRDVEYDLANKGIWQHLIAENLTNFGTLHNNGAGSREECGFT